jgi:transcriptional regulator with XRE-family HTH domain
MPNINAANLYRFRKRRDFTLDRLAELSGVNRTTINRIERGKRLETRLNTVESLAKALGVEPSDLLGQDLVEVDENRPLRPSSKYQFSMTNDARNALDLVAERYGVKAQAILHLAPFLFLCAAEQSLQKRRKKLEQAHEKLGELFAATMPQHLGDALLNNWYGDPVLEDERQSIARHDIFGERVPAKHKPTDFDLESENPFAEHLIEMGKDTLGLAQFESWSQFMVYPEYELLEEDAKVLTGDKHKATRSIIDGSAPLYRLPPEVRKAGPQAIAKWAIEEGDRTRQAMFGNIDFLEGSEDDDA